MLDVIVDEALDALQAALDALLEDESGLDPVPRLVIHPTRIVPLGLGGYVGLHAAPPGEKTSRLLDAAVHVQARASDTDTLADVSAAVTRTLLGADPVWKRRNGVLRICLQEIGTVSSPTGTGPGGNDLLQDLRFDVRFEYVKVPDEGEGIIETIPLGIDVSTGAPTPRPVLTRTFSTDPLGDFEVVDDTQAQQDGPSQWMFDPDVEAVAQRSLIRGGPDEPSDPTKPGTALVLLPAAAAPVRDFMLTTSLRSDSTGGIGLVFRWQDPQNHYYFLMEGQGGYRRMGKKVAGAFSTLTDAALDDSAGFDAGTLYEVRLVVRGGVFTVYLDQLQILEGRDAALAQPGRVGFLCRNNDQAFFFRMSLVQL